MDRISRSPAKDLQAHELMLRAWRLSDEGYEESNRAAQRDCEEAIRLDPHYSDAHSQLAWILWYAAWNGWSDDPEGSLRRALDCAERASSLNSKDYDALGARGYMLVALGKYDAAARIIEDLAERFPDHAYATLYQSMLLNSLGRHEEAPKSLQRALQIDPQNFMIHWGIGYCYASLGQLSEAAKHVTWLRESGPDVPYTRQLQSLVDALNGNKERAMECLAPVDVAPLDAHNKFHLGESFAMAGDIDRALDLLERAVDEGFYPYPFIADHCPFLTPLRGTPRFAGILAKAQRQADSFEQEVAPGKKNA